MNTRPKRTDSERDILEMQRAFIAEKQKNAGFQPSAQVIKVGTAKKQSLFAQRREKEVRKAAEESSSCKREKVEEKQSEPEEGAVGGLDNAIIGDIIERKWSPEEVYRKDEIEEHLPFPEVELLTITSAPEGMSLFAYSMERKRAHAAENSEAGSSKHWKKNLTDKFGQQSSVVQDTDKQAIHEENVQMLSKWKEEQILAERAELLQSMDPNLVKFLAAKRQQSQSKKETQSKTDLPIRPIKGDPPALVEPVAEILNKSTAEKWIHFDVIEKEKHEWMKDIPAKIAKLKPGESFEARFDWKGILLPYEEENTGRDDRELYLHGDEPSRPGYTLQELFRLARSNVIQQRISAFNAISGILNIYNQGFYDDVLELPITKIFFLLRFGLDENTPATLEVVSKGLSLLFYNDTDETILDLISETPQGYLQPILECIDQPATASDGDGSIESQLKNLKLTSSPFQAKVQENEDESKTSMNDFELAETDLVDCLLRTNIVKRISYILSTLKPESSTVFSCFKILIRIARASKDAAKQIASNDDLLQCLFQHFLPGLETISTTSNEQLFYNFPQYLVLKLFRILISQHLSLALKLRSLNLMERIKNYLFTRDDLKSKLIKVQIEALRIVRSLMLTAPDPLLFGSLVPAFRYMLEWHYHKVIYEKGGPLLIRQHAAAVLNAIACGAVSYELREAVAICCCKWFHEATKRGVDEFSQSTLLAACVNCASVYSKHTTDVKFNEFFGKYLTEFIKSKAFIEFTKTLSCSSILLKRFQDRKNVHKPLPNAGSVLCHKGSPQLVISQTYPVFFLTSLFKAIEEQMQQKNTSLINALIQVDTVEAFIVFLRRLAAGTSRTLAMNFFAKSELKLIFKLVCFEGFQEYLKREEILQASFNLLCCMSSEHISEIEELFEKMIFTEENLKLDQELLTSWKQIYFDTLVYPRRIVIPVTDVCLSMPPAQEPILPADWPYLLLKSLLNKYLQQMSQDETQCDFPESEIIKITFTFTGLLESNGLQITSPTEKLMYLMIAFMGPESQFLEPNMKTLLREHIDLFFAKFEGYDFQFDGVFEGKSKFQNLYVLFLDHFQAASYGDELFSALVMVPLAQKYDNKWRRMVWSEHASVLRFINCDERQLLGSLQAYLHPNETDESLIKCYARALNSNLLRANSIPYKIASHHLQCYKERAA